MRAAAGSARVVCGLGNGLYGRSHRHAVGLRLLEQLASASGVAWSLHPTLMSYVARLDVPAAGGPAASPADSVYLLWPLLPYNILGWCVSAAARRFAVSPGAVTIVHDDLDKKVGELRWKQRGSAGGNNGLKSVIAALGSDEFRRLRVGIGRPTGSGRGSANIIEYVLGDVPAEDLSVIQAAWAAPELQTTLLQPAASQGDAQQHGQGRALTAAAAAP